MQRIADLNRVVEDFVRRELNKVRPDLDVSKNSYMDDLFISPFTSALSPFVHLLNRLELKMNLENAELMTDEELESIGENNYMTKRIKGEFASGKVDIYLNSISSSEVLYIPKGTTFMANGDREYLTTVSYEFSPEDLQKMYDFSTSKFHIPVYVIASDKGERYNIEPNSITEIKNLVLSNVESVTNLTPISGGEDLESKADYAGRIRQFYITRFLGCNAGYVSLIRDVAPNVEDIYVSGKNDPYMTRDIGTFGGVSGHIGGKVDIYLKGTVNDTIEEILIYRGNKIKVPFADVDTVHAQGNSTVTYPFISIDDGDAIEVDMGGHERNIVVKKTDSTSQLFKIENFEHKLRTPFKGIISFKKEDDDISYSETDSLLTITDDSNLYNEDELTLVYSYNKSINNVNDFFNKDENRIITTDVLVKEAIGVPVNLKIRFKMKDGMTFSQEDLNYIRRKMRDMFRSLTLEEIVDENKVIRVVYCDSEIMQKAAYMETPLRSIYVPADTSLSVEDNKRDETPLRCDEDKSEGVKYFYLNKMEIDTL